MGPLPRLLLLVGENTVPNYLAVAMLRPDEVVLLYTPQSDAAPRGGSSPKKRLKSQIDGLLRIRCSEQLITDAAAAACVEASVRATYQEGCGLHYTGGTNVMAAHSVRAFYSLACPGEADPEQARRAAGGRVSYLYGATNEIRYDFGLPLRLADDILTLDLAAALHDVTADPEPTGLPTPDDAIAVAAKFLGDDRLREDVKLMVKSGGLEAAIQLLDQGGVSMSCRSANEIDPPALPEWKEFLKDKWLERWTGALVSNRTGREVWVDRDCFRGRSRRKFNPDVACIFQNRFYYLSCTTNQQFDIAKLKLLEAVVRARQSGGDLARAALVWSHNGDVNLLRQDVETYWDSPNPPRVFGYQNLRAWAGVSGGKDLSSLHDWLDG